MPSFTEYVESDYDEEYNQEHIRTRILRKGVGIIEMISFGDESITYCPHCRAAGFQVKLGPKIIMPGQERQPDYEQWLQCPSCAEIVAAYIVEGDSTIIKDDLETISNPFENTTEILGANPKRNTKAGQRLAARRRRNKTKFHDDPEVNELIRKYGDRVTVHK